MKGIEMTSARGAIFWSAGKHDCRQQVTIGKSLAVCAGDHHGAPRFFRGKGQIVEGATAAATAIDGGGVVGVLGV